MPINESEFNIADLVNKIEDEIDRTLEERNKDKYFEQVVLIYSLIENILKWLVFVKIMWEKSDRLRSDKEIESVRKYCKDLSFLNAQRTALVLDIIDLRLYRRIDDARKERNDAIHQFWLYAHRGNNFVLRKKLEKLARLASDIIDRVNDLVTEIGVEEVLSLEL